jgi:hypothetical protein
MKGTRTEDETPMVQLSSRSTPEEREDGHPPGGHPDPPPEEGRRLELCDGEMLQRFEF